jgi:hypothetical protein
MNLEQLKNQTILLLGKPRAFSQEEFLEQINVHNIGLTKELSEAGEYVLEGRMMTPYEQNLSDELYEKGGYTFLSIDDFEKLLAEEIDDDVLLMSLKLSNDKERLKSFLQNSCISDSLFFKLLEMYSWGKEDFFENDDNRDVTAALIGRFYENIERNHNVEYATTGLLHLVTQTQNPDLLEAISTLEPLQFHPKLSVLLAQHPKTPKKVLKKLLRQNEPNVLEALSLNSALDTVTVKELAKKDRYAAILAENIVLNEELFKLLFPFRVELAANETVTQQMQNELLAFGDCEVDQALARNVSLTQESIEVLMQRENSAISKLLLQNPNIEDIRLFEAMKDADNYYAIANNPALSEALARELFETGEAEVLEALAKNEATPVDILYQLQLDSRFDRAVKTNAAFGKHIQSENIGWLI